MKMATKVVPTKANLLAIKAQLSFARKGYELLDRKRTVLIKEIMELNKKAESLQEEISKTFDKTYDSLKSATVSMGSELLSEISKDVAPEEDFEIINRSVMGVDIPEVKFNKKKVKTEYSFHDSTMDLDDTSINMQNLLYLIYELAQIESSCIRLADEIKKTVKRANALDKIQIPRFENTVKYIEDILGEKEREDFFRMKKVKKRKKVVQN